jgi:hypothetical protein
VVEGLVPALPTDAFVTFSKRKRQIKPKTFGDCVTINPVEKHKANNKKCLTIPYSRTNHPPKIDAKWVKKDNSNSIKIGCTLLDGAFVRNGYNQQKIAASQFGELFL